MWAWILMREGVEYLMEEGWLRTRLRRYVYVSVEQRGEFDSPARATLRLGLCQVRRNLLCLRGGFFLTAEAMALELLCAGFLPCCEDGCERV